MRILNSFKEGLKIALRALRMNKIRSFLTVLCIVIGITMVTIVDSVTTGMDIEFDNSMAMLGTNVVYVNKWPWGGTDIKWWEIAGRKEMEMSYVDFIEDNSQLATHVSASVSRSLTVRHKDKYINNVDLNGATTTLLEVEGLNIATGRMFMEEEVRRAANVVVIGKSVEETLFENQDAIGQTVRFGGKKFVVIGVLEKRGSFLGMENTDNRMIIPISTYGTMFGLRWGIQIGVKFPNEEVFLDGEYEIEGLMRRVRQLDAAEENDFFVNKPDTFKEQLATFKNSLYIGGFVLVSLSLLIGGIGIMNIMFVTVRERTKEIGIRKAVGAQSWEILSQFLIEAIMICLFGGVVGVLLAGLITIGINQVFTAVMNTGVVVFAFVLCTIIGAVFGFIPAFRAAKADPVESLRFD